MWNNQYQYAAANFYAMNGYPLAPFYIPYPLPESTLPTPQHNVKIEQSEPTYSPSLPQA
jgi:hypothetical protein